MDYFKLFYTLIGGLGLFLFGMKGLSEGLQSLASNVIKKAINLITRNRVLATMVGVAVTCFVQSSSVSTVMMTGMVNAGLMNLSQGIGFILGANIGTTITGWIISIKVGKYGLLLIGLGVFPMIFGKRDRSQNIGKLLFALGLVFFGLQLMGTAFKPLRTNEDFIGLMEIFSTDSKWGLLACFTVGMILTMIIQSSSAMLGITIVLASQGAISFHTAAALVLGENIGTTITIWLASIGSGRITKRLALSHTMFNVFGVFLAFLVFAPYVRFVDTLIYGDPTLILADGTRPHVAIHIAAVHTIFNISMAVLFLPLLGYLKNFVTAVFPVHEDEHADVLIMDRVAITSPELAINEGSLLLKKMGEIVKRMMDNSFEYLSSDRPGNALYEKIERAEKNVDAYQYDLTLFLGKVLQISLTSEQAGTITRMIRIADELESVGDYVFNIVNYRKRVAYKKDDLTPGTRDELKVYMNKIGKFYDDILMHMGFDKDRDIEDVFKEYRALNNEAENIKDKYLKFVSEKKLSALLGMTFSDIMIALRRIKNHSLNIAEALAGGKSRN